MEPVWENLYKPIEQRHKNSGLHQMLCSFDEARFVHHQHV